MQLATVTVTLDGSGSASAMTGPGRANVAWRVTRLTSDVSNETPLTMLQIFTNSVIPANYMDGTRRASHNVSELVTPIIIDPASRLVLQWSGGPAGAIASVSIYGDLVGA